MSRLKVTAAFCLIGVINQVAMAQFPKSERVRLVYRAGTIPDPQAAHRVALALGEGKHIVVRLYSGKTHRGHIQSIDEGQFQVRLDRSDKLLAIQFDQVAYLEKNLTRKAKIALIAAAAAAAVVTILFLALEYGNIQALHGQRTAEAC